MTEAAPPRPHDAPATHASSGDPARAALDAAVLAWMREPDWEADPTEQEARFDALARELFAFQFARCAPYRRFCEGRGRTPERVSNWREIPAVPTGAFKEVALRCFPAQRTCKTFRSSGTSTQHSGELHLDTLELYEASLLPSFERHVLPDVPPGARLRIVVVAPSPLELPHSSLSHLFGAVIARRGDAGSRYLVHGGSLDVPAALAALEAACTHVGPVALCGTSFGFVHLIDALAARGARFALPAGTRVMETGGFKGRSRELSREALHGAIEAALGVPAGRCVNQYGMTELGSQFHDGVLREPGGPRRKLGPPWARARVLDPVGGGEAPDGELGVLWIYDLANTGSVLAVQTADLARRVGDGFEVLGREPGAEARGCSLAADLMLGGAASPRGSGAA